ncbi:M56 family metallopeptidase [Dyella silvatica]|uniref:M56 family metallopeptidase n=1 Tax=Dyella silvatica TaxID=2992128 RepID=UPI00225907D6|nr:M56 family metallopeptidase [Dyella silvatica]
MSMLDILADTLLSRLIWTSIQAALLIGVLWLLGRWLPRLSPAVRSTLWWLVGAQLILGLTVNTPVKLPLLAPVTEAASVITSPHDHTSWMAEPTSMAPISASLPPTPADAEPSSIHWRVLLLALWLAGVLVQLWQAIKQWRQARAVLRDSTPLDNEALQTLCMQQAHALGLRRCPALRVSPAIASPQVMGLWRPTVLLPAGQALSEDESAMAMAHELAHVQRGDLWLGWVPAIAQRLFFFHPGVTWATREYAINREAACDAQVLQRHRALPHDYGRLLLRLGVVRPMHAGLAGASPTFQNLKRRLIMLQETVNGTTPRAVSWLLVAGVALAGVLPYRVTAADAHGTDTPTAPTKSTAASVIPLPPPPPVPPAAPIEPGSPPPPLPPPPPRAPPPPAGMGTRFSTATDISIDSHAKRGFALFDHHLSIISGTNIDLNSAKQVSRDKLPMVWFRRGDKAYVIHDAAFVRRARDAYTPANELSTEQGRLSGEQGRLSGEQSGLAAREGALAARIGELEGQRAGIEAERAALPADVSTPQRVAELDRRAAELNRRQAGLNTEQAAINESQAALSRQEAELGKREEALSKQQSAAAARAEQQMDSLLDEALAKGLAQPSNQ